MLHIQFANTYNTKIGRLHGLSESKVSSLCESNQTIIKDIFSSKSKYGYHFLTLPDDKKNLMELKKYVKKEEANNWKHIVILGIGGSALGPLAVRDALVGPFEKGIKLHVLDNIDPALTEHTLSNLPLSKTKFVVISKSGTTTEPMVLYALVKEKFKKKFPKNYQKHLVFITDPKNGLLRKIGKEEGIHCFDIPPKIGGRFSVLTNVGLLPCALAGMDITNLLKGAREMREAIKRGKGAQNPALKLAFTQYLLDRKKGKTMTILMPYSNYLFRIGDWYRQLLAESIGKSRWAGPTPVNALGTTDQHSQLQLFNDGPNNKLLVFMRVLKHKENPVVPDVLPQEIGFLNGKKMSQVIDAAYQGTAEALTKHKRPNITIEIPKVDARHIGALFMLFEFEIAILGKLYKVDAFNQPGVEHSKKITKSILKGE